MKKIIRNVTAFILVCSTAFTFSACNSFSSTEGDSTGSENSSFSVQTSDSSANNPPEDDVIDPSSLVQAFGDFHTPLQAAYLLSPYEDATKYATGTLELSRPQAITLSWDAIDGAAEYYVQLATSADFADAETYITENTSYDLYNLYLACEYHWRVAQSTEALEEAAVYSFTTTESAPRNIYLDGVTNVRDLGGWQTESGARVKQGLLYRGGRLNTSDAAEYKLELTDEGATVFRDVLGIKTELDIRLVSNNEVGSIDGGNVDGVNYVSIPMTQIGTNLLTGNIEPLKEVFALLANEDNYPVYFHCNIGTDRTGLIAFLVNALLGVGIEDLYRDYLFSNFGVVRGSRLLTSFKATYGDVIEKAEGDTFAEKTAAYLLDLDVITREQIDSIRRILLPA